MINHSQNCSIARDNSHSGSIAFVAHCWQAVGRVDRAVRPILDEYTRLMNTRDEIFQAVQGTRSSRRCRITRQGNSRQLRNTRTARSSSKQSHSRSRTQRVRRICDQLRLTVPKLCLCQIGLEVGQRCKYLINKKTNVDEIRLLIRTSTCGDRARARHSRACGIATPLIFAL